MVEREAKRARRSHRRTASVSSRSGEDDGNAEQDTNISAVRSRDVDIEAVVVEQSEVYVKRLLATGKRSSTRTTQAETPVVLVRKKGQPTRSARRTSLDTAARKAASRREEGSKWRKAVGDVLRVRGKEFVQELVRGKITCEQKAVSSPHTLYVSCIGCDKRTSQDFLKATLGDISKRYQALNNMISLHVHLCKGTKALLGIEALQAPTASSSPQPPSNAMAPVGGVEGGVEGGNHGGSSALPFFFPSADYALGAQPSPGRDSSTPPVLGDILGNRHSQPY